MSEKKKIPTKAILDTSKKVAEKAKFATDVAKEVTGISKKEREKASIQKDVEDAVRWVEKRNQEIKNGTTEVQEKTLPTLTKVIFGGEHGIKGLPEEDQERYINFFKKNASQIALLTAMNPIIGIGAAGAELAASGIVSDEASVKTAVTGAGIIGASVAATMIDTVSYATWYAVKTFVPPLRLVGVGMLAFGAGATLFKSVAKLPQGQKLAEVFDETQVLYNECYDKIGANIEKMGDILSTQIKSSVEKLELASKKMAITIDDALHSDQNLRIMQYQQIVLDQYNNQNQIKETLDKLVKSYNALKIENEELTKEILAYKANMQTLICGSEYLK